MSDEICPQCLRKGTVTTKNRTPLLSKGEYCVACGYKQPKAPTLAEIRSKAAKSS